MNVYHVIVIFLIMAVPATHLNANAETMLLKYEAEAKKTSPGFKSFSVERGKKLYFQREITKKGETSCATCHLDDPRKRGRTRANKDIEPMAPSANPMRFTDQAKVEKWFTRNCDDVFGRPCTPVEKGDFIRYLMSEK